MSNFQNKPICPDGANSDKIIDKMIKRASSHKTNPLKELVFKQLRSKQFSEINIDSISDFPIFKRNFLEHISLKCLQVTPPIYFSMVIK